MIQAFTSVSLMALYTCTHNASFLALSKVNGTLYSTL